jgi:general secretion pathway protein G
MILSARNRFNQIRKDRRRSAFTLMEVLVVVAILVVLASVASVYVFRYLDDSKVNAARTSCTTIANACKAYALHYGGSPESLQDLVQPPDGNPYLESASALVDPWGQQFQMQLQETPTGTPYVEVYTITPTGKRISSIKENNQ